jgi:MFS family permease
MAVSALAVLFSEKERPKAVGIWATANMVGFPIGPILGGWLLSHYWWGWVFLMKVPVAIVGFLAVAALVPESRSEQQPGIDLAGIALSSAGLVGLTYGFIEAGQHAWGAADAIALMIAGVVLIVSFFAWEQFLARRPGGQPLVDLSLFRSVAFTWGVILFAVLTLALVGLLFTLPQYFQGVMGTNAAGSGIRLLPVVVGFLVGLAPASSIAKRIGAKLTVAAGFAVLAAGLVLGASTTLASGEGFSVLWLLIAGVGTGLTMATAASAALAELSKERAGVGSAVLQALKNTGRRLEARCWAARWFRSTSPTSALAPCRQRSLRPSAKGSSKASPSLTPSTRRFCSPWCGRHSSTAWTMRLSCRSVLLQPECCWRSCSFPLASARGRRRGGTR